MVESDMSETLEDLDPMMVVSCSLEVDDDMEYNFPYASEEYDKKSETENYFDYLEGQQRLVSPKRFASELPLVDHHGWTNCKRILLNKNQEEIGYCEDEMVSFEDETGATDMMEKQNMLRYACPVCGKMVSTKGNLKVHVETHRPKGKYACEICGRM